MMTKKIFSFIALFLVLGLGMPALAQVNQNNLSNTRVDELSDDQVRALMRQIDSSGMGEAQLEQIAQARGMQPEEIKKLRERVIKLREQGEKKNIEGREQKYETDESVPAQKDPEADAEKIFRSKIFGADLFSNADLTFEPNLNIATPKNYVIGPGDELQIDIYGNSEASYKPKVSPEGNISIEYVGLISVGGLTIEAATSHLRSRLATVYSGLRNGNTNLNVAIGNIRSIRVILTGELVKPGTYTLPSLASVFNALYASGGPTVNGSLRNIEQIRAGKKIATLDIYDFLMQGEMNDNLRLQDQDVIRVPVYQSRIEITGEVKRPGIFELRSSESLADLFRYAGGFTENAFKARVKVLKNTDTERKIMDINSEQFASYLPNTGDKYFVDRILERFANRVSIEGAVFRPGEYELEPGLSLLQLINKAHGLQEDAFQNHGFIIRLKPNNEVELVSFDLRQIMNGQAEDIVLRREDNVVISSIFDLKEEYNIRVEGEVIKPGELKYAEGMSLEDAIIQAGGFKDSATPNRVEISRRVKNSDALSASAITAEVFQINVDKDLKIAAGFELTPFDIITVRPSSGYEIQKQVRIEGEVLFPGTYTLIKKDERISDLIKRAGGMTALAYTEGASLKRTYESQIKDDELKSEQFARLLDNAGNTDTKVADNIENRRIDYVGIDLPRIMDVPGSQVDIFMEEGDVIYIPKELQTIKITGEVLTPASILYLRNKGFKSYISNAGGFSQFAKKGSSYIIYANGTVESTKKILFFNNYPTVKPGAEIFVPRKAEKERMNMQQWVGMGTGLASLAAILVSILR